jgi:hypothetical protein
MPITHVDILTISRWWLCCSASDFIMPRLGII